MWSPGDRVVHGLNRSLGAGRILEVQGRRLTVEFPDAGETLQIAAEGALAPLSFPAGSRARLGGETVVVEGCSGGHCWLADGREVSEADLWPLPVEESPVERLARGRVDAFEDFANRLAGLRLARLRQAGGLGSFLGGRIHLFPHQLYAAERAASSDPVRWLLADEVGLGKTVEACLILNRLIHTGRAGRTLIVAPETLVVQWLGELWRKHHQIFALLDDKRLADVERDHGAGFNPFEVHPRAIVSLETLTARRRLTEQAVAAGIDLLVVDEAHHLKRPPAHPGNAAYRAVAPIAALNHHLLLLTATPLEDDAHGFFRLLQLLRPDELPEELFREGGLAARLARREPLPPGTSSTRRADIGGLPPRVPAPVEIDDPAGWAALARLEERMRRLPAGDPARRARKLELVRRALASPAALAPLLLREDPAAVPLAAEAGRADPRVAWLAEAAVRWGRAGEKSLIFVAHRETLEVLKTAVEASAQVRAGVFHEELSAERRDIEVAQFRLPEGPSLLISTEAGGEGRNFEFCHRLVLFDLPWNPSVVEQRIGRLDRIGRTLPTEIVYFRPPGGLGRTVAELLEGIGLFREPLGGLERELRHVTQAVERLASEPSDEPPAGAPGEATPAAFAPVLAEAREAHDRVQRAAFHELHRDPYRPETAPAILARVPPELERLTEEVVRRAAARFGFGIERGRGRTWVIEYGAEALVEHLPGVPLGSRFLGTFDREEAVADESLDFFASGHPLVEGVLAELEDGPRGRVALLQVPGEEEAFGLLALYRRGEELAAVAVDRSGRERPDLAERLTAPGLATEVMDAARWTGQPGWTAAIRKLAAALPADEVPQAVAAFRVRRASIE